MAKMNEFMGTSMKEIRRMNEIYIQAKDETYHQTDTRK